MSTYLSRPSAAFFHGEDPYCRVVASPVLYVPDVESGAPGIWGGFLLHFSPNASLISRDDFARTTVARAEIPRGAIGLVAGNPGKCGVSSPPHSLADAFHKWP